jgi:putative SOS response-associated peptidase YedK
MCGRYLLTTPSVELIHLFGFSERANLEQRWNIAPTQAAPVVAVGKAGDRHLRMMRWGFHPSWKKTPPDGAPIINARIETAADKPFFRTAIRRRRCIVPCDGWYEWAVEGKTRQPFLIRQANGVTLGLGAVWEYWESAEGALESFAIITRPARKELEGVHHRMPLVLPPEHWQTWLDRETPLEAALDLAVTDFDLSFDLRKVNAAVGNVRMEGEALAAVLFT